MAIGMKGWLAVTGLGFAIVIALTLPPRPGIRRGPSGQTPERMAEQSLAREAMLTAEQLRRSIWLERETTELSQAARDGDRLVVGIGESSIVPQQPAEIEGRVQAELS